jgi:hypothetical protein
MRVKQEGLDNDLLDRLQADKNFWSTSRGGPLTSELDWEGVMDPMKYVGRSVEQTERFIKEVVEPLRESRSHEVRMSRSHGSTLAPRQLPRGRPQGTRGAPPRAGGRRG